MSKQELIKDFGKDAVDYVTSQIRLNRDSNPSGGVVCSLCECPQKCSLYTWADVAIEKGDGFECMVEADWKRGQSLSSGCAYVR